MPSETEDLIVGYFHLMRSARKTSRRQDAAGARLSDAVLMRARAIEAQRALERAAERFAYERSLG